MRLTFALGCFALATTLFSGRLAAAEPPLQIVTATYLGTAEDDDRQGACAAPDGTIYVGGGIGVRSCQFLQQDFLRRFLVLCQPRLTTGTVGVIDESGFEKAGRESVGVDAAGAG